MIRRISARILWVGGCLFVVAGLSALSWCGYCVVRTAKYQARVEALLDRELIHRPVGTPAKAGEPIGTLNIPRLGISSVILEGTDEHTLSLSVGHISDTALPWNSGNTGLAAHRDTFFRGLRNVRDGDRILLTWPGGTRVYEVDSTRVVSPDDGYVLDDVGRPLLTLVTCYPFHYIGPAPERFIVQAHPLDR